MDSLRRNPRRLFDLLLEAYGGQDDWWPGRDDPFEVVVGAILTQRTTWRQAASAVDALRRRGALSVDELRRLPRDDLEALLRPAGFFRAKAGKLLDFCAMLSDRFAGTMTALLALPTGTLRETLLSVSGIGDETADAILIYAAGRPSFVVDAYTRRLLVRLGWIAGNETYRAIQDIFSQSLPMDAGLFAQMHALIICHAKKHCRVRPACDGCPLRAVCAYHLPQEGDA